MINPDKQELFELSDNFHQLGNALGAYIQNNKLALTDTKRNALNNDQIELLRISGQINLLGVALVFIDLQDTINRLNDITTEVNNAVKKALAVQDAINLAASLVSIGTAIIAKDPQSIIKNTMDTGKMLHSLQVK